MQRLLDVSQPTFDLGDDFDKIIDIEPSAGRTCDDRNAAFAELEGFQDLPADANLFVRFGGKRNADRVADAFVKQDTQVRSRI